MASGQPKPAAIKEAIEEAPNLVHNIWVTSNWRQRRPWWNLAALHMELLLPTCCFKSGSSPNATFSLFTTTSQ
ncbi:hypothetical protein LINPERPRIM_LOCUS1431 [Linum perenne]